jgi:hypothetical protein
VLVLLVEDLNPQQVLLENLIFLVVYESLHKVDEEQIGLEVVFMEVRG